MYFERGYPIDSRDVDPWNHCKPSGLRGILQEAAVAAACELHASRPEMLEKYNLFWMLARMWYRLDRPLGWNETLTVRTWHRGGSGASCYRDFDLFVDGKPVGEAVSVWVLADVDTHRLARMSKIAEFQGTTKSNCVNDPSSIREFLRDKSGSAFLVNLLLKRRYINLVFVVVGCILEFSATERLREQHLLSNKLLSTSRCGAFHVSSLKRIVKILFIGNKQFNRVAGVLGNCLQQKGRLQNSFLVGIKSLISDTVIVVKNRANIMRQIFLTLVIKELPKHINREQGVIILRPKIVNKPLEAFDFIATVILDKVKHTTLVGIKRRGDMF